MLVFFINIGVVRKLDIIISQLKKKIGLKTQN